MEADDQYKRLGERWKWRTPSPDFARRAVSPISPPQVRSGAMQTNPQIPSSLKLRKQSYDLIQAPELYQQASQNQIFETYASPTRQSLPTTQFQPPPPQPPQPPSSSYTQPTWEQSQSNLYPSNPLDILATLAVTERANREERGQWSTDRSSRILPPSSAAVQPPQQLPIPPLTPLQFDPSTATTTTTTTAGYADVRRSTNRYNQSSASSTRPQSRGRKAAKQSAPSPQHSPALQQRELQHHSSLGTFDEQHHASTHQHSTQRQTTQYGDLPAVSPLKEQLSPLTSRASLNQPSTLPPTPSPQSQSSRSPVLARQEIVSPLGKRPYSAMQSPTMEKTELPTAEALYTPAPPRSPEAPFATPAHAQDEILAPIPLVPDAPIPKLPETPIASDVGSNTVKAADEERNASLPTPTQDDHVIQDPVNLLDSLVVENSETAGSIAQFTPEATEVTQAPSAEDVEMADAPTLAEIVANSTTSKVLSMPTEATREEPSTPSTFSEPPRKRHSMSRNPRKSADRATSKPQEYICQACHLAFGKDGGRKGTWVGCDACEQWTHAMCAGFEQYQVDKIDKFYCIECQTTCGPPTMKRSSNRAHTAIDYNALHNGSAIPLRNPDDARIHPYINKIRNDAAVFVPENFQRLRPDVVTAEYLDNIPGGWREPFVIPAEENKRPWHEQDFSSSSTETDSPSEEKPEPVDLVSGIPTYTPQPPPVPPEGTLQRNGQPITNKKRPSLAPAAVEYIGPREGADQLDMRIPKNLTVRQVAEYVGMERPVEVFDVLTQMSEKDHKWKMADLVNYFENPIRDTVYNCISCEVSNTPLGEMISRPKAVRDTDLVDKVWPATATHSKPTVGKYVLMSVRDSFTDFHIDFAGSSVFYHVYEGEKVFLLIEPSDKALKAYEEWSLDPDMNAKFFPESVPDHPCYILKLKQGDTMFIPSGWIHAVYTPVDTLVVGGNFLTKNHYLQQMRVNRIEVATDVKLSQRYPRYSTLMWYTMWEYCSKDPIPSNVDDRLLEGRVLQKKSDKLEPTARHYTPEELDGLLDLLQFLHRNVFILLGLITTSPKPGQPKMTQQSINAIRKAVPDPINKNPLRYLKIFARWVTWIRASNGAAPEAGERIPEWAYREWQPPELAVKEKKQPKKTESKFAAEPRRSGLRERRGASKSPAGDEDDSTLFRPLASSITPLTASTNPSASTPAATKRKLSSSEPRQPSNKKPKSLKPRAPSTSQSRSEINVSLAEGESKVTLSDGSIYVRKNSNLGPPRAGCQNCRLKKTGCKHKEEIAEILRGSWNAARRSGEIGSGSGRRGRGRGEVVEEMNEGEKLTVLDEYAIESDSEDEREIEKMDTEKKLDVIPKKKEAAEMSSVSSAKETDKAAIPPPPSVPLPQKETKKVVEQARASAPKEPTLAPAETVTVNGAEPAPTVPETAPVVPEVVDAKPSSPKPVADPLAVNGTPATPMVEVEGPPAGFKGRKPSCKECKALKKKCLHPNTWGALSSSITISPTASGGRKKSSHKKTTPATGSSHKRPPSPPPPQQTEPTLPLLKTPTKSRSSPPSTIPATRPVSSPLSSPPPSSIGPKVNGHTIQKSIYSPLSSSSSDTLSSPPDNNAPGSDDTIRMPSSSPIQVRKKSNPPAISTTSKSSSSTSEVPRRKKEYVIASVKSGSTSPTTSTAGSKTEETKSSKLKDPKERKSHKRRSSVDGGKEREVKKRISNERMSVAVSEQGMMAEDIGIGVEDEEFIKAVAMGLRQRPRKVSGGR